jgi:ribosomal protein L20A (L18A)
MIRKLKFAVDLKLRRITIRIPEISEIDNGNEKVATV